MICDYVGRYLHLEFSGEVVGTLVVWKPLKYCFKYQCLQKHSRLKLVSSIKLCRYSSYEIWSIFQIQGDLESVTISTTCHSHKYGRK